MKRRPNGNARNRYQWSRTEFRPGAAGVKARVLTAIRMELSANSTKNGKPLKQWKTVKWSSCQPGTGNPFFTTDTGSSLRGYRNRGRCHAERYPRGWYLYYRPEKDPTATKFDDITYDESLAARSEGDGPHRNLHGKENNLPIIVFDMDTLGNLKKVMTGESIGTFT